MKEVMSKAEKISNYIYIGLFVLFTIVIFWKCPYGYANLDESFYLTFPYRFLQGDRMLYDEWFGTQMVALPLMPILSLYIKIKGNLEGIFIFIRYLYSVVKVIFALVLYFGLKKYSKKAAMATSLVMLLFSAYGLMVFSYNNLSIGGLVIWILCMIRGKEEKGNTAVHIIGGIAFSLATIEIPHIVVLFIIYAVCVLVKKIKKIESTSEMLNNMLSFREFIEMLIGVIGCVVAFCCYIFSKITLSQLIQTLPHIALEDTVHPVRPWYKILFGYFSRIAWRNDHNYFTLACYAALAIAFLFFIIKGKKDKQRSIYTVILLAINFVILLQYFFIDYHVNFIMFAPNVLAFILYFVVDDSRIKDIFYCFWIPGMIYSFLGFWASNTGIHALIVASSVAVVGSVMMIGIAAEKMLEVKEEKNRIKANMLMIYLVVFLGMTLYGKVTDIFWENGISEQTERITDGLDKGLLVSKQKYDYYYGIMEDTKELRNLTSDYHVLYFSDLVLWISGEARFGTHTSLNSGFPTMLYQYYEEHPDKVPDYVYIEYGRLEDAEIVELQQYLGLNQLDEKEYGVILKR